MAEKFLSGTTAFLAQVEPTSRSSCPAAEQFVSGATAPFAQVEPIFSDPVVRVPTGAECGLVYARSQTLSTL